MFNVLDIHNKYTVRIFIVSLYKITKIIDYKIAHQPTPPPPFTRVDVPPHLLLELMSLTRVRCTLRGKVRAEGGGESGTSTREDRSKTAQKPLKSCLKNRSKITARNERFLSGFLSKIWAVWAVFPKKPPKPPKPLKPLKPLKSCWKTAQTAQILSGFWAGSRPGQRRT